MKTTDKHINDALSNFIAQLQYELDKYQETIETQKEIIKKLRSEKTSNCES